MNIEKKELSLASQMGRAEARLAQAALDRARDRMSSLGRFSMEMSAIVGCDWSTGSPKVYGESPSGDKVFISDAATDGAVALPWLPGASELESHFAALLLSACVLSVAPTIPEVVRLWPKEDPAVFATAGDSIRWRADVIKGRAGLVSTAVAWVAHRFDSQVFASLLGKVGGTRLASTSDGMVLTAASGASLAFSVQKGEGKRYMCEAGSSLLKALGPLDLLLVRPLPLCFSAMVTSKGGAC